jgi:hypothetical protein
MEERFKNILNWKNVLRGSILFFMFTIIGLLTSSLWKGSKDAVSTLRSIDFRFLAVMFLLIFVDWVLMGYRVFIFASRMSDRVSFWDCFRANLANTCIGAITPSQTGGWAGQLYILYRSNITLAGGATITVITFLFTLLFFLFSALFVIVFDPQLLKGKMVLLMEYCFVMFGIVLAIFILLLLKPHFALAILSRLSSSRLFKFNHHIHRLFQRVMIKLEHLINDYKDYTELFIKRGKKTLLLGVFITFVIYFNKFTTAYVIARALDDRTGFWNVIFIQILLTFISYFSPTPGGSGISEISSTFFMKSIMLQGTATLFTLIWRFSTTYLELFVGGIIIVAQLRKDIFRNTEPTENKLDG